MKIFDYEASIDNLCYLNYMEEQETQEDLKVNVVSSGYSKIIEATPEKEEKEK